MRIRSFVMYVFLAVGCTSAWAGDRPGENFFNVRGGSNFAIVYSEKSEDITTENRLVLEAEQLASKMISQIYDRRSIAAIIHQNLEYWVRFTGKISPKGLRDILKIFYENQSKLGDSFHLSFEKSSKGGVKGWDVRPTPDDAPMAAVIDEPFVQALGSQFRGNTFSIDFTKEWSVN